MHTQLYSYVETKQGTHLITFMGYSTKGIPGLEIVGLGSHAKVIKEKILYFTQIRKLKTPKKRYVITLDSEECDLSKSYQEIRWSEFPLLLIYWHLAGLIPISRLSDCVTVGRINPTGVIEQKSIPENFEKTLDRFFNQEQVSSLKEITYTQDSPLWAIDSLMLLQHIPNIEFSKWTRTQQHL